MGFLFFILLGLSPAATARPMCTDVFEIIFFNPGTTNEEHRKMLGKLARPPSSKEVVEALLHKVLELPDAPPGTDAYLALEKMIQTVTSWPRSEHYAEMELLAALHLRKICGGGPVEKIGMQYAITFLESDRFLPEGSSALMWKHRFEVALIRDGQNRKWPYVSPPGKLTGPLSELWPVPTGEGTFRHVDRPVEFFKRGTEDHWLERALSANVLGALVLDPTAKSHKPALARLLQQVEKSVQDYDFDTLPMGLLRPLRGYLNPSVFPSDATDPMAVMKIRAILKKLNIPEKDTEPRDF